MAILITQRELVHAIVAGLAPIVLETKTVWINHAAFARMAGVARFV